MNYCRITVTIFLITLLSCSEKVLMGMAQLILNVNGCSQPIVHKYSHGGMKHACVFSICTTLCFSL